MAVYIYIIAAFIGGFLIAWFLRTMALHRLQKEYKSVEGRLESERLIKENMQKENNFLLQSADASLLVTRDKLSKAEELIRNMDHDILLLQKSNEETEALMEKGQPALHEMKMKLIEANNTIARYKAQFGEK